MTDSQLLAVFDESLGFEGTVVAAAVVVGEGMIATWLILPVVIRSSQRLSHACLSINLLL